MSALNQLIDMGIPKPRARAALVRTKDDVMSAAVSCLLMTLLMAEFYRNESSLANLMMSLRMMRVMEASLGPRAVQ
jgi:hypothetical protein